MVKTVKNSQKTVKTAKFTIGVPIVTCLPRLYQQCTSSVPIVKNSQKTVKTAKITIGVPIVTCLSRLYQQYTNSVPIVKNSQKTSKQQKWHYWCINRHRPTKTVATVYQQCTSRQKQSKDNQNSKKWPLVYQSSHVYTESVEYTKSASAVRVRVCVRRIHKAPSLAKSRCVFLI